MTFGPRRVSIRHLVVIAVTTATFAACGTDASRGTIDAASSSTNVASNPTSANLGIDFTASLLDGSPLTLKEQLAQKPVALWFWAPG